MALVSAGGLHGDPQGALDKLLTVKRVEELAVDSQVIQNIGRIGRPISSPSTEGLATGSRRGQRRGRAR